MKAMNAFGRWFPILLGCVALTPAFGQTDPSPTVDTVGNATVEAAPDFARFDLTLDVTGVTLAAGTEVLLRFESDLRDTLDELELTPGDLRMSGIRIADAEGTQASIIARVQFAFVPNSTPDERARALASVTDRLRRAVSTLKCSAAGPYFGVDEREPVEQEAVARATENALYKADSVASLMNASIVAVEQVTVLDVEWGQPPSDEHWDAADTRRLACTARVRVVYRLSLP